MEAHPCAVVAALQLSGLVVAMSQVLRRIAEGQNRRKGV